MSEKIEVHTKENTQEEVAYKLFFYMRNVTDERHRQQLLDQYAECLEAVRLPHLRLQDKRKP
jgi:hypothetical protein